MPELPEQALAQELIGKSRAESSVTPVSAVIAAARDGLLDAAAVARLWTLEPRHLYEIQPVTCTGCGECLDCCSAPGALVEYGSAESGLELG